jgi:pyruvate dehydrogenase E1 component alpha subunit
MPFQSRYVDGVSSSADDTMVQLLTPEGKFKPSASAEEFLPYFEKLTDADYRKFYREMVTVRRYDTEATNLQRQGQLALWVPSHGQEGAQVGSAFATKDQDHIFPAYREHAIAHIRGVDLINIIRQFKGFTHGGWDPFDPKHKNFHIYTLVIGSHALHSTGYAMGIKFDGATNTGKPDKDQAVIVYFGDGATSQGDVSEAFVFAASYQTPQVFFIQNNHWAISVPVSVQARVPLYTRGEGFGVPGTQIDGNDVFASFAVTAKHMDDARSGKGPSLIEAHTYRIGAHTSSDDPTKYRSDAELQDWIKKDPIARLEKFLKASGTEEKFFAEVHQEAADFAADIRRRTVELTGLDSSSMFDSVYSEPHVLMDEQRQWLAAYDASFEEEAQS